MCSVQDTAINLQDSLIIRNIKSVADTHKLTTVLLFYVIVFQFEVLDWLLELAEPSELLIGL